MSPSGSTSAPVLLVWGEEALLVRQRAQACFQAWCAEVGGMDHEVIDAGASHSGEALKALGRLREALQTLPFFGTGKVIWFQGCTFLGDDRVSGAQAVTEALMGLAQELAGFRWAGVRLIVSAGKVDKRRTFARTLEKIGRVEEQRGLRADDKDWPRQAAAFLADRWAGLGKSASDTVVAALVTAVGPQLSLLQSEADKVAMYVGIRPEITAADVSALAVRNKQARAFALGDALGDRDLPRVLRVLEEELWELRVDREKSAIGLLYGLISKVRVMLLARELMAEGWLKPESDYRRFQAQLTRLPADRMPADRRYNPLAINPYVLFRAAQQAGHYTSAELVSALERMLECNRQLVSSDLDDSLLLQRALIETVHRAG